jgi:uncharacterized protein (AIM24 family)
MTAPTGAPGTTYRCPYCRQESAGAGSACPLCGAPVDITLRTTSGGWIEMPPIADMTHIQAGQSAAQIEGNIASVADWTLAAGDTVYFPHNTLVWCDPGVTLSTMPMSKPWQRHRAGLPLVMAQATGPGHVAFSPDAPGEILALPLQAGGAIDVCEHRLIVATNAVGYDWYESGVWYSTTGRSSADEAAGVGLLRMGMNLAGRDDDNKDNETRYHYPVGQFVDRFIAGAAPGLVMINATGNAFMRDLAEGETVLVKPPSLLFKDPTVAMQLHVEYPSAGARFWRSWGNRYLWLRLWGPGRIGIESAYEADEDPGTDFGSMSQTTQHRW